MPTHYAYELWNGKVVLGHYGTQFPLQGLSVVIPTISELKRIYDRTYETITVPLRMRLVSDNGVDFTYRLYLDVRRKSQRQIQLIRGSNG